MILEHTRCLLCNTTINDVTRQLTGSCSPRCDREISARQEALNTHDDHQPQTILDV